MVADKKSAREEVTGGSAYRNWTNALINASYGLETVAVN